MTVVPVLRGWDGSAAVMEGAIGGRSARDGGVATPAVARGAGVELGLTVDGGVCSVESPRAEGLAIGSAGTAERTIPAGGAMADRSVAFGGVGGCCAAEALRDGGSSGAASVVEGEVGGAMLAWSVATTVEAGGRFASESVGVGMGAELGSAVVERGSFE